MLEVLVLGQLSEQLQQRGTSGRRGADRREQLAQRQRTVGALGVDLVDRAQRRVRRAVASAVSIASPPPARRSSTLTTPQTSCPLAAARSIAAIVEPPVVTTSSTTTQRSPAVERRPLDAALQPVLLALLAHEERLRRRPAGERGAGHRDRAHGMPPTAVAPHCSTCSATQHGERRERLGRRIARLAST